jgi:signal peptidase I
MNSGFHQRNPVDTRVVIYRIAKQLAAVVVLALAAKYAIVDAVRVGTDQMAPTIENGDRVLLSRLAYAAPLKWILNPARRSCVVYRQPFGPRAYGCLRIAAVSGDSIRADSGKLVLSKTHSTVAALPPNESVLSPLYSPRDFMAPLRIPKRGETITLNGLSLRDFFFIVSMIRQENSDIRYTIKPALVIDGRNERNFRIGDFALYKGPIDSVGQKNMFDWFFWDKLSQYLGYVLSGHTVGLTFELLQNNERLYSYTVKSQFVFLIADNWVYGNDSRYFGPVKESLIRGRAAAVLWSFAPWGSVPELRWGRIGKLIK